MSNVEGWERRNALPKGCAICLIIICFLFGAVLLYYSISRLLFFYADYFLRGVITSFGMSGFCIFAGVGFIWRLYRGKPIPFVGTGGEPPPLIEIYDFLPEERKDEK